MTPRDVDQLTHQLRAAARSANKLCDHAEDLHNIAFERHVGDHEKVSGGDPHPGVENVGDPKARRLWRRLAATATHLEQLVVLERLTLNYLAAGPAAEEMRGALQTAGEFRDRLRNQKHQQAAGEYVPTRFVDQPGYGGTPKT